MIIDRGHTEDMYKLNDMLNDLICGLKVNHPKMYHEYKTNIYELAYGRNILEDRAIEIVANMVPYGEYFTMDIAKRIAKDYDFKHSTSDVYLVLNSMYNDYSGVFGDEDTEVYIKLAKKWLEDKDAVDDKVYVYFTQVVKER